MFLNRRVRNKSNLTAKCAKTANKNGSFPRKPLLHSQKVFAQREPSLPCLKSPATGAFPLSSILPTVVTQNLRKFLWPVSPCSYRSRCSRFMFLTGVSAIIITAKGAKIAKVFLVSFSSFVAFLFFAVNVSNRGVRNNYNRETHENREQKRDCPQ